VNPRDLYRPQGRFKRIQEPRSEVYTRMIDPLPPAQVVSVGVEYDPDTGREV
jgi:hypothetical protein